VRLLRRHARHLLGVETGARYSTRNWPYPDLVEMLYFTDR
jgi:hypothetical protein